MLSRNFSCAILLLLCLALPSSCGLREHWILRLPDAKLLTGWTPHQLVLSTPSKTWEIQPEINQPEIRDEAAIYPSISRDGRVVAFGRLKSGSPRIIAIATWTLPEGRITEYAEGECRGSIAISPDGSKLAFIDVQRDTFGGPITVIELSTGLRTRGPTAHWFNGSQPAVLSWSPDSDRIAYDEGKAPQPDWATAIAGGAPPGAVFHQGVFIWDLKTGEVSPLADGRSPSWSPDGKWIAYLEDVYGPGKQGGYSYDVDIFIIHPDATGATLMAKDYATEPPVWSPDSRRLLLSELATEEGGMDLRIFELGTARVTKKFKNRTPVWGWSQLD